MTQEHPPRCGFQIPNAAAPNRRSLAELLSAFQAKVCSEKERFVPPQRCKIFGFAKGPVFQQSCVLSIHSIQDQRKITKPKAQAKISTRGLSESQARSQADHKPVPNHSPNQVWTLNLSNSTWKPQIQHCPVQRVDFHTKEVLIIHQKLKNHGKHWQIE